MRTETQKQSQNEILDKYLKAGNKINPMTALKSFGIMRLASRISDLNKLGRPIETKMIKVKTRFCGETRVAEYGYKNN